jgi:hypothetical protein
MVLIRLGNQKLPLSVDSNHAVYVRLIKHPQPVSQPRDGGQKTVSALLTLLPLP